MFLINGKPMQTWNVFVGCRYDCIYCNARKSALTRFKHADRYKDGFNPHLVEEELWKRFSPGQFVFIGYMGELSFASQKEVEIILQLVRGYPEVRFLFCVKNPACYQQWGADYPDNLYLGATIETDIDYGLSKAPSPYKRFLAMASLPHPKKFISIEPIMEFRLNRLISWLREIKPDIIEVGADNYHNHLQEPSWCKVQELLGCLRDICPTVVEKPGLERLKRLGMSNAGRV